MVLSIPVSTGSTWAFEAKHFSGNAVLNVVLCTNSIALAIDPSLGLFIDTLLPSRKPSSVFSALVFKHPQWIGARGNDNRSE